MLDFQVVKSWKKKPNKKLNNNNKKLLSGDL